MYWFFSSSLKNDKNHAALLDTISQTLWACVCELHFSESGAVNQEKNKPGVPLTKGQTGGIFCLPRHLNERIQTL